MNQFRKKPVVIEAVQFTGGAESATPIIDWILQNGERCARYHEAEEPRDGPNPQLREVERIAIDTLEGTMSAIAGDWIIKGVNGEFYPCKPDIFEKTYDPVTSGDK